jgi:hypothetical protein
MAVGEMEQADIAEGRQIVEIAVARLRARFTSPDA